MPISQAGVLMRYLAIPLAIPWAILRVLIGLALTSLSLAPIALGAPPLASDLVKPALYAKSAAVAPGRTLWLDLHLTIAPGWHTYWRNPGDAGLPTTIDWTLPAGVFPGGIGWAGPA